MLATLLLAALVPQGQKPAPTFCADVAPIVFGKCAQCHRPGEVAPFPLLTYADVKKRGATIAEVVADRFMPPWHPEEGWGEFQNCLRLSDAQVKTIVSWVKAGMPEGDRAAMPPLPKFPDGWQLGEPDLIVQMPNGFEVPASGRDIYRNFAIPLGLQEDAWVTAIEVRPGAREVLHHVLFFLDDTGEALAQDGKDGKPGYSGMRVQRQQSIGGWAVGGMPEKLPEGLAIKLPKGNDLILQSHFHPSGKKAVEQTTLGIHLSKEPPKRTIVPIQLPPLFGVAAGIDIPAGQKAWTLADEFTFPCDVEAVTVGGHAHMLLKSMTMQAEIAGGEPVRLLRIDDWDFDWQNRYTFRDLVAIPKDAKLKAELVYDNSKDNPNNPNKPPKRVRWGRESTDEMGSITLMVVPKDEADLPALMEAVRSHAGKGAIKRFQSQIDERFAQLDQNKDGKVTRDEAPQQMAAFFDFLDLDKSGALDKDEVQKALEGFAGRMGSGEGGGLPGGVPGLPGGNGGGGGGDKDGDTPRRRRRSRDGG
jgi:hypothetical protein